MQPHAVLPHGPPPLRADPLYVHPLKAPLLRCAAQPLRVGRVTGRARRHQLQGRLLRLLRVLHHLLQVLRVLRRGAWCFRLPPQRHRPRPRETMGWPEAAWVEQSMALSQD